jgi:ActR/RegA family two-component response regulator
MQLRPPRSWKPLRAQAPLGSQDTGVASQGRVVFLDDDDDLRGVFATLVGDLPGRSCVACRSYGELVARRTEVLTAERAILDVNLGPGEPSGVDAYRWLREQGFTGPILFLTGYASSHPLVHEAQRLGDARVLAKPAALGALQTMLDWRGPS